MIVPGALGALVCVQARRAHTVCRRLDDDVTALAAVPRALLAKPLALGGAEEERFLAHMVAHRALVLLDAAVADLVRVGCRIVARAAGCAALGTVVLLLHGVGTVLFIGLVHALAAVAVYLSQARVAAAASVGQPVGRGLLAQVARVDLCDARVAHEHVAAVVHAAARGHLVAESASVAGLFAATADMVAIAAVLLTHEARADGALGALAVAVTAAHRCRVACLAREPRAHGRA